MLEQVTKRYKMPCYGECLQSVSSYRDRSEQGSSAKTGRIAMLFVWELLSVSEQEAEPPNDNPLWWIMDENGLNNYADSRFP
ncbi:hypothetical protein AVEN_50974-1 [Araneus ventricosus]|uniref:Uncharacterized protein n=1 Tax=Araneus ventricosus TaxID=182803 RepID=A0A4Y2KLF1_ARAVE|nr:hypothetical protein AVEN_50974-1 [Araneus ventricosus]